MQVANNIISVSSGQEALQYLQSTCSDTSEDDNDDFPNLIFLDLNLPDIQGFELLDQLKNIKGCASIATQRTVLLTNSMQPLDLEKAENYQLYGYLVKPLTTTKIKNLVAGFMGLFSTKVKHKKRAR